MGALLIFKLVYLAAYIDLPFLYGGIGDSHIYLGQAFALSNGELSDPRMVAFSPLYGGFLYLFGGLSVPLLVVVLQLIMGSVSAVLIARMLQRRISPLAGWLGAGLYVTYGVFIYYETKLLSETLALFLVSVGLTLFDRLQDERTARSRLQLAAVAGLVFGLCTLARASFLFCLPPLVLAVIFFGGSRARRAGLAVALCLGMAAPLLANGLKTWVMTGHFIPVVAVSSTVEKTTTQDWDGLANLQPKHDASADDVVREAAKRLASDTPMPSPRIDWIGFFRGAPGKVVEAFSPTEYTYQYGYYGERAAIGVLRVLPGSFAFIAIFGLVGLGLALRGRMSRELLLTAGPIVVGTLGMMCLFHPSSRYRMPMTLGLLMLAAGACATLWQVERARRGVRVGLVALFVALAVPQVGYTLSNPAGWHFTLAQSHLVAGNVIGAEAEIRSALALAPDDLELRRRVRALLGPTGRRLVDAERPR